MAGTIYFKFGTGTIYFKFGTGTIYFKFGMQSPLIDRHLHSKFGDFWIKDYGSMNA